MNGLGSISDDTLAQIITTISLVSAAGFGLLGLLTDYKVDGKVTLWGKIAAGGIVLSAIFSILSGIIQNKIDAKKAQEAADQAKKDSDRFTTQIGELAVLKNAMATLNADNKTLQSSMKASAASQQRVLSAQSVLLSKSEAAMLLTARLTGQENANTAEVLKSLWFGVNRIEPARVALLASVDCEIEDEMNAPAIFSQRSAAVIMVVGPNTKPSLSDIGRTLLSYSPEFEPMGFEGGQTMTWFRSFLSFAPEEIADPEIWRTANVTIRISGAAPAGFANVKWRKGYEPSEGKLSCEASYMLIANGHMVATGEAPLKMNMAEGVQILTMEDEVSIEDSSLPRYKGR